MCFFVNVTGPIDMLCDWISIVATSSTVYILFILFPLFLHMVSLPVDRL